MMNRRNLLKIGGFTGGFMLASAKGLCYKWRKSIGYYDDEPVPKGVHYDLWLGRTLDHEVPERRRSQRDAHPRLPRALRCSGKRVMPWP
jgi:hypothetical protein